MQIQNQGFPSRDFLGGIGSSSGPWRLAVQIVAFHLPTSLFEPTLPPFLRSCSSLLAPLTLPMGSSGPFRRFGGVRGSLDQWTWGYR